VTGATADIIALAGDDCDTAARPALCRSLLPSANFLLQASRKDTTCTPYSQHAQNVPRHFVASVLATWDCIINEPRGRPINTRQALICRQVGSGGPEHPKTDSQLGKLAGRNSRLKLVQYWQQLPLLKY
jgi:hypothetical protein